MPKTVDRVDAVSLDSADYAKWCEFERRTTIQVHSSWFLVQPLSGEAHTDVGVLTIQNRDAFLEKANAQNN